MDRRVLVVLRLWAGRRRRGPLGHPPRRRR
nr:MAG TPA: hypothetical protein [Caudoviricetes sp.]